MRSIKLVFYHICILFFILCSFSVFAISATKIASQKELTILTWSDYMDPVIVAKFESQYQVQVNMVYFEGNDERDRMLTDTDGTGYDLVMLNDPVVTAYVGNGWLDKVEQSEIENLRHIQNRWKFPEVAAQAFTVPYFWGTTGIAYRADLVPYKITSWKQFFDPNEILSGKISVMEDVADVTGMALKALGYSANSVDRSEHKKLKALLNKQKPSVKTYKYISLSEESELVTGKIWAAMAYSGDALMIRKYNKNIEYVVPEEGGNLWVDYFALLKSSTHKEIAKKFLNFINIPKIAARNAQFVHYATPNQAAAKHLKAEFLADKVIYPAEKELSKSEFYIDLPPRILKLRNSIFSNVTN